MVCRKEQESADVLGIYCSCFLPCRSGVYQKGLSKRRTGATITTTTRFKVGALQLTYNNTMENVFRRKLKLNILDNPRACSASLSIGTKTLRWWQNVWSGTQRIGHWMEESRGKLQPMPQGETPTNPFRQVQPNKWRWWLPSFVARREFNVLKSSQTFVFILYISVYICIYYIIGSMPNILLHSLYLEFWWGGSWEKCVPHWPWSPRVCRQPIQLTSRKVLLHSFLFGFKVDG